MNCEHCQQLLLDHLYGLLDAPEAAALDAHLASCPACAEARAETARLQGLFARAAKSTFPNTKFEPPVEQPTKSSARTPALSFPASAGTGHTARGFSLRVAAILPWAVAAAVLIAIPTTVVPVLGLFNTAELANREVEVAQHNAQKTADTAARNAQLATTQREKNINDAELRLSIARQTQQSLAKKWTEEQSEIAKNVTTRKFSVDVQKPATIQPGAPNDFIVVVNDRRDWETVGKKTVAEIHAVDASDAVIYTQPLNNEKIADRMHPIRLPASAWAKVKPNAELFLVVAEVDEKTQTRTELQERIRLAGPVFTTMLVTDKAAYRPGERLFFRSLTLDRITFKPPAREQILKYELLRSDGRTVVNNASITGTTDAVRVSPEGQVAPLRTPDGQPVRGVGCGEFVLPADLPDGDYILRLTEGQHPGGFPATLPLPVTRTVKVRSGTTDNYHKEIGFTRESFVPGETVEAWAEVKLQDKLVANLAVANAVAEADGAQIADVAVDKTTDVKGRARVRFTLPSELLDADVRLKVAFRTPQGDEVVASHVPVIGNRVNVEFFPECGDNLIAGVPCKVYVRATTPAGQPVNFRGVITDGRQTLAKVESFNDPDQRGVNRGLASFTYTPQLGVKVWLKLESPSNVYAPVLAGVPVHTASASALGGLGATALRSGFMLPPVKTDGVVMTVLNPVTAPGEPIRLEVYSVGQPRKLLIGAYTRGKLSDMQRVFIEKTDEAKPVSLMAGNDPRGGVVRITVFEEGDEKQDLTPVAERLVFRKPGEVLNLTCGVTPQVAAQVQAPQAPVKVAPVAVPAMSAVPTAGANAPPAGPTVVANSPIDLSITATDEKGNPTPAILYSAVVNSGVAPGARDRSLRTHFLLAGEVKNPEDLEFADFLLTNHPKAAEALDLLLGTQGWRRFVEQAAVPVQPAAVPPVPNVVGKPPFAAPAVPPPEVTKLLIQNGQYSTWTEPVVLREQRELHRKFASRYEEATKAITEAQTSLEAARGETVDANAVASAKTTAEAARRAAEEKQSRAEAAREPVRKFRANVWYGVAGLVALALGCGFVAVRRSEGRFPMSFSTLGSVALAAFLIVAANWGDDAKATAKDGRPQAVATGQKERDSVKETPTKAGAETVNEMAPPKAPAPEPMLPTVPYDFPLAKPEPAPQKGVTPASGGVLTGDAKNPPASFKKEKDTPKPPSANGGRPSFQPYPPPPVFNPGRYVEPKPSVVPVAPEPPRAAPPMPAPLSTPGNDPKMNLTRPARPDQGRGIGWQPNRPNGVSATELATGQQPLRQRTAPPDVTAEAEALKRDIDCATNYRNDRLATNGLPVSETYYYLQAERVKLGSMHEYTGGMKQGDVTGYNHYGTQVVRGAAAPPPPPLVVREFAAPRPMLASLSESPDTPDTVLWQPMIVLPVDGKTVLSFHVGCAPAYEVIVAGHTPDGRLGSTRSVIVVSPAKTVMPTLPASPGSRTVPVIPNGVIVPPAPTAPPPPQMP